jgi:hypothetical protein
MDHILSVLRVSVVNVWWLSWRCGIKRPGITFMAIRVLLLVVLGLLPGCWRSSDLDRAVVSGKVSYQGKPVPEGMIAFVPIKDTKGPTASAIIKDGGYEVVAAGGVPLGTHRVEVQAFRALPANRRPNRPPALQDREPREQYLPEKYNRQSTMEVTIASDKGHVQDFDLK